MSLTQAEDVFVALHEDGLNDLLRRFFTTRPRYLRYGSPAFVGSTSVSATAIDAISFPGIPGGIQWAVGFEIPRVDVHPQSDSLPPELDPLGIQRVSIATKAEICIDCRHGRDREPHKPDPEKDPDNPNRPGGQVIDPVCADIEIFAIASAERFNGPNGPSVRLIVNNIELVDVEPNPLESVLECLLLQIVRAAIAQAVLPLEALSAGFVTLTPVAGPNAQDDQIDVRGTLTV